MPGEAHLAVLGSHPRSGGVGDIPCLYGPNAKPFVEVEGFVHLRLVVGGVGGGLMMTDDPHAALAGVGRHAFEVKIRIRLREAEILAIAEPVGVPANVPAFDENAGETVAGRKIDVAKGCFGGRSVARA